VEKHRPQSSSQPQGQDSPLSAGLHLPASTLIVSSVFHRPTRERASLRGAVRVRQLLAVYLDGDNDDDDAKRLSRV
jgi:hypothetical protein